MAREMKDSGIEWIGEMPKEWEIKKLKYLSLFQQEKYDEVYGDLVYIGLENVESWSGIYIETDSIYDKSQALIFHNNDILWGKLRPYLAKVYQCTNMGCCSSEFCVISLDKMSDIRFFWYLLVSPTFVDTVNRSTYGTKMPRANADFIKNMHVPIPSIIEQSIISQFLDNKCKEIDNILTKTRASIEEYKKLKQAVITQAVTKGIRGNREMKDSRSTWFGQIPSDWNMRKIKYIFKIQKDIAGEEGHAVLSITQKGIKPKDLSKNEGQLAENYSNYQLVHIGDFAMNHMDLLTGWVDVSKYEGVTSPDYRAFGLIDKDNYCSQYYLYLMQMCYTNRIFYGLGQGVSGLGRWRLQADKFLNFSITVPSYEEQKDIANYLDKKCSAIDELIAKKEQYLFEIENYKKSLIYEYVTGKKEVPQE